MSSAGKKLLNPTILTGRQIKKIEISARKFGIKSLILDIINIFIT